MYFDCQVQMPEGPDCGVELWTVEAAERWCYIRMLLYLRNIYMSPLFQWEWAGLGANGNWNDVLH
jgi:hypothetical protein